MDILRGEIRARINEEIKRSILTSTEAIKGLPRKQESNLNNNS